MSFSVILLGAGASLHQAGKDNPPLTKHLYHRLAEKYPMWREEQKSFEGNENFELAMQELLRSDESNHRKLTFPRPSLRSTELQWDLAEFFFGFTLTVNSLYERFNTRAAEAIRAGSLRFATLNYDTLLFQSLKSCGIDFDVGQIDAAQIGRAHV